MHRAIIPTVDPAHSRNERKQWKVCVAQHLSFRMSSFRNAKGWRKGNKKIALHYVSFNNAAWNQRIKFDTKYFLIWILYQEHGSELTNLLWKTKSLDLAPQGLKDTRVHHNMHHFQLPFPPFSCHCFFNSSAWGLVKEHPWLYTGCFCCRLFHNR